MSLLSSLHPEINVAVIGASGGSGEPRCATGPGLSVHGNLASWRMTNDRELMAKIDGNPEGKGVNGLLDDWRATEPRGVVAKPPRQVLADLFASMLVLSAALKYRPVTGSRNYLYWFDGQWSLSLIAPDEWSDPRRAAFVATCILQRDMTWKILPFHVSSLSYYQQLYASALSRSVCTVLACGDQGSKSSREWAMQLPHLNNALLAYNG